MRQALYRLIGALFGTTPAAPGTATAETSAPAAPVVAFRLEIDPASNPIRTRERLESRQRAERAERELQDLLRRVEKLEAPAPAPMPRSDPGRYVSLADLAGEVGGFSLAQLRWLLAARPVGFTAVLHYGQQGSHPVVCRRSLARWVALQGGGIGRVRSCLPSVPMTEEELSHGTLSTGRLLDAPVPDQYQLEAMIPELDKVFSDDDAIERRFQEQRIGVHKIEPILSWRERDAMDKLPAGQARAEFICAVRPGAELH